MKTLTVNQPVQIVRGYVPLIPVDTVPQWAMNATSDQHGSHTVCGNRNIVLVQGPYRGVPPGDWIVAYSYTDDDGCHDFDLYVAAKIA
jgi:hypothetical protein